MWRVFTLIFGLTLGSAASAQCAPGTILALLEIYSSADGAVQFIVLETARDDATLAGRTLIASDGAQRNTYTLPNDLPNRKSGQPVLIGTQGFADLNLVKPDYVVPNGFLIVHNGSIALSGANWCAGQGAFQYSTLLPVDGVRALYVDDSGEGFGSYRETAQAINNAGESYVFRATQKFSGLWWNSPPGSESGWGVAIDHQGDTVLAAWAIYGDDGSATWFVMPNARHAVSTNPWFNFGLPNTFVGDIYRMAGPAFSPVSFDPAAVTPTKAGSGGVTFSTDDSGNANYFSTFFMDLTNPRRYVAKAITPEIFSDPAPVCVESITPGPTQNFQGMWWNPAESGWGLHLTHQGDIIVAVWFTYDTAGKPTWFVMAASKVAAHMYSGAIYQTAGPAFTPIFDPDVVRQTQVGTGTLTFLDLDNGAFTYSANTVTGTKNIAREVFSAPRTVCN